MYFNDGLDIKEVILLESIYYFGVFILEVPSGYFSDVLGRKITLVVSSIAFSSAYLLFGFTDPNFVIFALAQILLACGYSFMSGTNTSFYYESLQDQGLEDQFPAREAKVQSYLRYSGGLAALIGGIVGSIQLRYGFGVSLLFMIPALIITLKFSEPDIDKDVKIAMPLAQLSEIWTYLKSKELRWMFVYATIIYVLSHIPYEFYQPYLTVLEKNGYSLPMHAALFSGLLFAGTRVFGAIVAGNSVKLSQRFGLRKLCYTSIILQLLLIGILAAMLHPAIILYRDSE